MSGSSVGAMVVGTVFIMVFGMATVSLIDNVNQSIKNSDFELPNPKVDLISVTDSVQSPGPVNSVSLVSGGNNYAAGGGCTTTTTGDPSDGVPGSASEAIDVRIFSSDDVTTPDFDAAFRNCRVSAPDK